MNNSLLSLIYPTGDDGNTGFIIEDLAVHDADMILWLLDDASPISVHTVGGCTDPEFQAIGEPDVATSVIKFDNGVIATVDVGFRCHYAFDVRSEVQMYIYFTAGEMEYLIVKWNNTFITKNIYVPLTNYYTGYWYTWSPTAEQP